MNADIRSKLELAEKVQVFNRAHPVTDPGIKPVFDQVDESIDRARALITTQVQGREQARTANATRRDLKSLLKTGLLRVISNIFADAATSDPSLGSLKAPAWQAPNRVFIEGAEALVAAARDRLDVLAKHGLTTGLVDEAEKLVAQYRTATETASAARQEWVHSSAELEMVGARIMGLVDRIHGLNRHRFANQPDLMATWEVARNLVTVSPKPSGPSDVSAAA